MKRLMKNFWKNEDGFSYTELIVILAILVLLLGFAVPSQIRKIDDSKRETDQSNATLIGNSVVRIIKDNDRFKDYTTTKLNVNNELATNSETLDDDFINTLLKEFNQFKIDNIPNIKYKKGGYDCFSVTIAENKVYVYADDVDNGEDSEELELYSSDVDR